MLNSFDAIVIRQKFTNVDAYSIKIKRRHPRDFVKRLRLSLSTFYILQNCCITKWNIKMIHGIKDDRFLGNWQTVTLQKVLYYQFRGFVLHKKYILPGFCNLAAAARFKIFYTLHSVIADFYITYSNYYYVHQRLIQWLTLYKSNLTKWTQ